MVVVKTGVLKVAPTKATEVKAASLYQVKVGLVTVVELALMVAVPEPQIKVGADKVISAAVAASFTFTVITLALAAELSHLLSPFTVK